MMQRLVRVLVIEDDATIQQTVAEVLREEGYLVDVATHGGEALDAARRAWPDVILLDLNLPVMDGWQFREALLSIEGGGSAKLILMTADNAAADKARRLGACAFLEKPFDLNQMLAVVCSVADSA